MPSSKRKTLARWATLLTFAACSTPVASALAESATATKAPARTADPYLVKLREGDAAYLARDYAGAAAIYSEAIKAKPQAAAAHLRLGEALRAQAQFDQALVALDNAARFAATLSDRARAKFMIADTHERALKWAQAKALYAEYAAVAADHQQRLSTKAPGVHAEDPVYPESAVERTKQVDAVVTRTEQYAAVKARIEKREAEISAKAKADAAKKQP